MVEEHDIAIIGAGGAGLTAALYAARGSRSTAVFERKVTGGQIATTDQVENFPGFPDGVNGFDLAMLFEQQAEKFGARLIYEDVEELRRRADGGFLLRTDAGEYVAQAVLGGSTAYSLTYTPSVVSTFSSTSGIFSPL